ncbi:MAG: KTSC domain-containing protein [Acidobacteriota bacterium]|nr:KTSC domain-containing protein [Acidobacteriota bacterium]
MGARAFRKIPVDSSTIAWIGDRADRRELELQFRETGEVYRYFEVPIEEHEAFLVAESKGIYWNQVFKAAGYRDVALPARTTFRRGYFHSN